MSDALAVREPFREPGQQARADRLGMFVFLATEAMLFGALVLPLVAMRLQHPDEVRLGSQQLEIWFGTANTAILLTSSACVALASGYAARGSRFVVPLLGLAVGLGLLFLAMKGVEYLSDFRKGIVPFVGQGGDLAPATRLFLNMYYVATGLHGLHVLGGIGLLGTMAWRVAVGRAPLPARGIGIELAALYWHFVDVVWVFLFPALYLVRA